MATLLGLPEKKIKNAEFLAGITQRQKHAEKSSQTFFESFCMCQILGEGAYGTDSSVLVSNQMPVKLNTMTLAALKPVVIYPLKVIAI